MYRTLSLNYPIYKSFLKHLDSIEIAMPEPSFATGHVQLFCQKLSTTTASATGSLIFPVSVRKAVGCIS